MSADEMKITRTSCEYMDSLLGQPHEVLDHGFVRVIDYMGDDAAICQAARVSYGDGTKSIREDRGLIRYLMSHAHTSPFEMCEIKLHVKLPIFVARQWIRHRTANVNEYSARYSILDREFYIPDPNRVQVQSMTNKQGSGQVMATQDQELVRDMLKRDAGNAFDTYEFLIGDGKEHGLGLSRELARMNLPTNVYTQWYWKVDIHNLLHFLRLRMDPHAQYEIRVYADIIAELIRPWIPFTWEAFEDYVLNAVNFSAMEMQRLLKLLPPEVDIAPDLFSKGMTDRETKEFLQKIRRLK